jgi:hypothetical protein
MGTIPNGILGGFRGTVGPAVGSSWKGINVIRSRPPRKRRKSTEEQLKQMARLALMSTFIHPLTSLLNKTYNSVTLLMSCFNKALSYNLCNAVEGEYPAFRVNYTRVILGSGFLLNAELSSSHSASKGQLTFTWKDNSNEGSARASDQAFAAVYCPVLGLWLTFYGGAMRSAGSYTLDVTAFGGKVVHGYIGFLAAGGKFVSTSLYAGMVNIL